MAARQPLFTFLPLVSSLLSFILVLLLLLAGTNNVLSGLYYIKTDTTGFSVSSKLSSSTYLQDLSAVSGADLVGQPSTASSLGLAETYTVLLLTSCAHFPDGAVSCSHPSLSFSFDPRTDLRLDSTSLQGTYPQSLLSALSHHRKTTRFVAPAYILAAALLVLAPLLATLSPPSFPALAAPALSALAALLLLAAAAAAAASSRAVDSAFNAALRETGLSSSTGRPAPAVAVGVAAFALALLAAVVLVVRARRDRRVGGAMQRGGEKKGAGGLLGGRVPWGRHRYAPVDDRVALVGKGGYEGSRHQEGVVFDSSEGGGRHLDDNWAAEDEYSAGGRGIPLKSLGVGVKQRRDMNTAYEPYSSAPS
ncbi:putative integral membrane protein [Phialemonium atrogriseum]|uniref:Integral membrane protein n=1 Tax=Phialemonium atrogriseum TaxID=1093897 RepID=A0AAJ0FM95_9PEZI|nr:putative integral membrane protein [Phialemonium atrogriseum]KAK1768103.1 putative integral membrane protein [Phialemonium atrogriseum]